MDTKADENWRRVHDVLREFAADRLIASSRTQKTGDGALQRLSNGVDDISNLKIFEVVGC